MDDDATLRGDFDQFDVDGNGSIDRTEFASLVDFLGLELSGDQVGAAFDSIDVDGSAKIEFSEFKKWWLQYQES